MTHDEWLIHIWCLAAAILSAASCSLLGAFLVLRRMSLVGDAISHSVLPGLALAFLLTGTRDPLAMFIGAALCGLLTAFLSQFLYRHCRVDQGAALGVVFTTMFALGVVLIRVAADRVDLDPGCVLYGMLEFTPFDTLLVFNYEIPRAVLVLGPTFAVIVILAILFAKELKITSFDPVLATALGFSASSVHFGLMAAVAATSVAAFESVGSILVVAMFTIPGASARLLTDSYFWTIAWSLTIGVLSAVLGYIFAVYWNTSVAGMMASVALVMFLLIALLAPRYGALARVLRQLAFRVRVYGEDVLGLMFRCLEEDMRKRFPLTEPHIATAMESSIITRAALIRLRSQGFIRREVSGELGLTESGLAAAKQLVRTHRLWERYLVDVMNIPPDHVHSTAMTLEHHTTEQMTERLSEKVLGAVTDPHGKGIPKTEEP